MNGKIRYRLVYNYARRLTRSGVGLISLECRQDSSKFYISSKVQVFPEQWYCGKVVNHENAEKLNVYLYHWKSQIEEIELNALLEGQHLTLKQLKDAVKHNARESATVKDFVDGVIMSDEERKESTKQNYISLVKDLVRMYGDKLTIADINRDFVVKFRKDLMKSGLSENTVKGRLKMLKTVTGEAQRRNLLKENPFADITIGNMTPRTTYLTFQELQTLESITIKSRKEAHIRDAFVWCCCVGLRYSDFVQLNDSCIVDGVLSITQQKTGGSLTVPLTHLFGGKPMRIMERYPSIADFAKIGNNSTVNKMLKKIVKQAGIDKPDVSWHTARHTAGTLLNQSGLKMQEIQKILGHAQMSTTADIYAITTQEQVDESLKRAFASK